MDKRSMVHSYSGILLSDEKDKLLLHENTQRNLKVVTMSKIKAPPTKTSKRDSTYTQL